MCSCQFQKMSGIAETLVIGASAAGLATAAELRRRGREFEIVEAEDVVAASWRRHYDRLHLHTPKGFSGLRGPPMPKSWPRYPARDQVVEYLEQRTNDRCPRKRPSLSSRRHARFQAADPRNPSLRPEPYTERSLKV
jgi:cation diffusion facilitator CzcD-associated flavoprotein CzcO